MRRATFGVLRLWIVPVTLIVWELVTRATVSPFFPPPTRIVEQFHAMWLSGPASQLLLTDRALETFGPSLGRLLLAWVIAGVLGVALGVALGRIRGVADYADPVLQFLRALPPPLLVPIFFALFEIGTATQLAVIVFGVIWPVLVNTTDGVRAVDKGFLETARVFQFSRYDILRRVILPAAMPKIFAGLRLSLSLALILMVVSELVGSNSGIGYSLLYAQQSYDYAGVWAHIVLLGVLGLLFNALFLVAEGRVLSWHAHARRTV
ncbi:ABC transporter permease [Herbidospora cretacea]|uniref:ABC transporter permease n=1 Tax=Herbidospora cretacea TaxID=28444 RepID=UPI000B17F737|nr:ABC transporter permease [Herbidospora cretacea]